MYAPDTAMTIPTARSIAALREPLARIGASARYASSDATARCSVNAAEKSSPASMPRLPDAAPIA